TLTPLRSGSVQYEKVRELKRKLLEAAFDYFYKTHFDQQTPRSSEFRKFLMENAEWLADYSLFRVLMEENGGVPTWDRWTPEHRSPRSARTWLLSQPTSKRDELLRKEVFFMYVQWLAFSQWQALKAYGSSQNVYLMGDIPFGVGRYSADAWANRALFDL